MEEDTICVLAQISTQILCMKRFLAEGWNPHLCLSHGGCFYRDAAKPGWWEVQVASGKMVFGLDFLMPLENSLFIQILGITADKVIKDAKDQRCESATDYGY